MRRFPSYASSTLQAFDGGAAWVRASCPARSAATRVRAQHAAFWRLRRLERLAFRLGVQPHLLELVLAYRNKRAFRES